MTLLHRDETPPFNVINPSATAPVLLVCDHASRKIPASLGTMGLDPVARICHLAWDIGAGRLTELLAASLGVTGVLCRFSRLVIDCNRNLLDAGAFLEFGDGVIIRGNRNLSDADKRDRAEEIYWPYHSAVDAEVDRLSSLGPPPCFFAIHSFTPVMNGISRPWEIGVLWDADRPTAEAMIEGFSAAGFHVGDNEPYSGKAPADFTIDHHAEARGLPHVGIEIRQDLIADEEGVNAMADVMEKIIKRIVVKRPQQEAKLLA